MKTYMALDGLRWSRDSGSVHCNMPGSVVFGRSGGGFPAYGYSCNSKAEQPLLTINVLCLCRQE